MKTIKDLKSLTLSVALGLAIGAGILSVQAWTEPSQTAPGGNLGAPLNTSATSQYKQGALSIGGSTLPTTGYKLDVIGSSPLGTVRATGGALLNTGNAAVGLIVDNGSVRFDSLAGCNATTGKLVTDASGTLICGTDATGTSGIAGSGTLNRIPKWTPNGTTLGDSMMWDDGGSAISLQSNSATISQMLFRRSGGDILGRVYGSYNTTSGAKNMGFLDGDGQWSYLQTTDASHNFYSNGNHLASIATNGAVRSRYPVDNGHYGYFEFVNSSGARGGYLGYGNGGTVMNLYMDTADYLDIGGGHSIRYGSPTAYASMFYDNATSTKTGGIVYNGANQFVFARYANAFGAFEASPFIFDVATGKLHVNGGGLRVNSLANCGSGGKLTTDGSGNVICRVDNNGSSYSGINTSDCQNVSTGNDSWINCPTNYAVTGIYVNGNGCGGECVATTIKCCRVR